MCLPHAVLNISGARRIALLVITWAMAVVLIACSGAAPGIPADSGRLEEPVRQVQPSPTEAASLSSAALSQATAVATPDAQPPVRDRVARLIDGFPIWIGNGDAIPVSKSLTAEMYFAPYPPAPDGVLDILLRDPRDDAPITGARVELSGEMQYMDHGVLRSIGTEGSGQGASNGHYLVPVSLIMFGEWVMKVKVSRDEWREQFEVLVVVIP